MLITAMEATPTRRTIWAKRRSQSFFVKCIRDCEQDKWKRKFRISRATIQFLCLDLRSIFRGGALFECHICGEESGHYFMEARNWNWISLFESTLWHWPFNCFCRSCRCLYCHCAVSGKSIHCNTSWRACKVGSGWFCVKMGSSLVC